MLIGQLPSLLTILEKSFENITVVKNLKKRASLKKQSKKPERLQLKFWVKKDIHKSIRKINKFHKYLYF